MFGNSRDRCKSNHYDLQGFTLPRLFNLHGSSVVRLQTVIVLATGRLFIRSNG